MSNRRRLGDRELVALLASIMALGALGIDLLLPALGDIRDAFGLAEDSTQAAGAVTAYVAGTAVGTLLYGPVSDRFGRKTALYGGFALYAIGAAGSALAPSLNVLFLARVVWGVGAAGPRTMTLSIIRDQYEGDEMAKRMSLIFAIFIIVPIFAPGVGALILLVASWEWVFWSAVIVAGVVALWTMRLPETLDPANRISFNYADVRAAARVVVRSRQTVGYALGLTVSFGAFLSYLASSELILDDVYDQADFFPIFFGLIAAVMGAAMLSNSKIVDRLGMRRTVHRVLIGYVAASLALVAVALATDGKPPLWLFGTLLGFVLIAHALLIPNANSLAMDPVGAVAGTASSLIGFVSLGGGAILGAIIDRAYDGTITPLAIAYLLTALVVLGIVLWAERGQLQITRRPSAAESPAVVG
ncbi:MAG: multidrug effflux MFS transporter [Acidimicrobiia bacterium]|nr:multidrug effflux MFS transporter [Acidimicrobiia bacterium]NNF11569.1 multidrug effflux MFS transporter [Acidimicrobiia bacterium]NNL70450.1 multidrug effflux MFS transporter [Acidimicrobiia bacterium]